MRTEYNNHCKAVESIDIKILENKTVYFLTYNLKYYACLQLVLCNLSNSYKVHLYKELEDISFGDYAVCYSGGTKTVEEFNMAKNNILTI
jgi:hypothetical protein